MKELIKQTKKNGLTISTILPTDGPEYETAIKDINGWYGRNNEAYYQHHKENGELKFK